MQCKPFEIKNKLSVKFNLSLQTIMTETEVESGKQ